MTRKTQLEKCKTDLVAFMKANMFAEIELHPSQLVLIKAIEQGKTVIYYTTTRTHRMHTINGKVFGMPIKPKIYGSHALTVFVDEAAGLS
jgi:hypothetical protein